MSEIDQGWGDGAQRHRRGRHNHAAGRRRQHRSRRRRRGAAAPLLALVVVFAIFGGLAFGGYRFLRTFVAAPDYSGTGSGLVVVRVNAGDTITEIGATLYRKGVVKSARAFVRAAAQHEGAKGVQPGAYRLRKRMQASLALEMLLDSASRVRVRVVIPEGLRLTQILQRVSKEADIPLPDLERAAEEPEALGVPSYAEAGLEGYLYPATYTLEPGMPAAEVLRTMVERFKGEAGDMNLEERARRVNLTPQEAVTVASLVQAEGGRVSDFPKIARVIYNRLRVDRNLELDSTVLYALDKYGIVASNEDLRAQSPYNTYRHGGLPPGPICSPGRKALEAALKPADGNWFWFVTIDPEKRITKFTDSEAEFQRFREELHRNMGEGG